MSLEVELDFSLKAWLVEVNTLMSTLMCHTLHTHTHVYVTQVWGYDIMLDSNLKAWLIEVNTCPALHSDSPLDKHLKTSMVADLMNLVRVRVYDGWLCMLCVSVLVCVFVLCAEHLRVLA